MSVPVIALLGDLDTALADVINSIAYEETGLWHIIDAEGRKAQALAAAIGDGTITENDVIAQQETINDVLKTVAKLQMLLQFKLEIAERITANEVSP